MNHILGGSLTSPDQLENNEPPFVEDKSRVKKKFSFEDETGDNPMNDNSSKDQSVEIDDDVSINLTIYGKEAKSINLFNPMTWLQINDKVS